MRSLDFQPFLRDVAPSSTDHITNRDCRGHTWHKMSLTIWRRVYVDVRGSTMVGIDETINSIVL